MFAPLSPIEVSGGMILGDEVYTRVAEAILDGSLPPGHHLRDVQIAQQLGISRTPVREALQRLERFGLVEIAVGRYTRVSAPDDTLRHDTAEFTIHLMGSALRVSLGRCDDDRLAELVRHADAVVDTARNGDAVGVFDAAAALFREVTIATGNAVFVAVMREGAFAIERNLRGWEPFLATSYTGIAAWEQMRDGIAARDGDGAERVLRVLHGMA